MVRKSKTTLPKIYAGGELVPVTELRGSYCFDLHVASELFRPYLNRMVPLPIGGPPTTYEPADELLLDLSPLA